MLCCYNSALSICNSSNFGGNDKSNIDADDDDDDVEQLIVMQTQCNRIQHCNEVHKEL